MVVWCLCWHRTISIRNITQKQYSQFPPVHDFRKPWWGVAYVPCMTNLRAFYAWVIRWHVTCVLLLAGHWQGRRALSNHVCVHSVISMWHVVCLQHLARDSSEQSRSTTVLPINHVIQMPQCLSGFVNHDYCEYTFPWNWSDCQNIKYWCSTFLYFTAKVVHSICQLVQDLRICAIWLVLALHTITILPTIVLKLYTSICPLFV